MRKKHLFLCIVLLCAKISAMEQTALSAGDIAITSFNSDTDDEISFILLKDISANTKIYFTENGWDDDANGGGISPNWATTNDGTLEWTSTSAMKTGTQVQVTTPKLNATLKVSQGTIIKYGTWSLVSTSDSIIIYQGTAKPTDGTEVTQFIWAFNTGSNDWTSNASTTSTTGIPTGLVDGTNAISFNGVTNDDNLQYNCSLTSINDISALRNSLATESNYNSSSANPNYKAPICMITTWDGSTDSVWNTADNWSDGVPRYGYNVTVPNVATSPIISSGTTAFAGNLTIQTGETLTINAANALTVSGTLTITDSESLIINSGGSLIVKGTSTGNLKYIRSIATSDKWYLVSSPVVGETSIDILNNSVAIPQGGTGGIQYAIGTYSDGWTYNYSGTWGNGNGYSLKTSAAGNLVFIGTMPTSDYALTVFDTTDDYALYGNPYPSYIPANTNAEATNNILTVNTATGQDELAESTIWFWDQSTTSYITVNQASSSRFIAPSQGFFVKTKGGFGDAKFDFTENMQSHQTIEVLNRSKSLRPEIKVYTSSDANTSKTEFYYINGTTRGFDNGYDSSMFSGGDTSFKIFSGLVANGNGEKLAIQSLPDSDFENIIIPLGLNAVSGKEITFSINHQNLPSGMMVFIEDKEKKTIARVDEINSNYKIILDADSNSFGRFYLHTSTSDLRKTLDVDDLNLDLVNIYLSSDRNLRINGLQNDNSKLTVYNILGKKVFYSDLKPSSTINIALSNSIKQGIYIVKLETNKGNINKKIFLK